jgi:hypothetical protein
MPGKYPTIEALPSSRAAITPGPAGQVDGVATESILSHSDKNTLNTMFPSSPIYKITAADYRATAQDLLLGKAGTTQPGDDDVFPGGVDLNYTDSPDLTKGIDGFDTPYYPNLIANADPAGGEGTKIGSPLTPNDNFGSGATVDAVVPAATSAKISETSINVTGQIGVPGQSAAHDINVGASTPMIVTPS